MSSCQVGSRQDLDRDAGVQMLTETPRSLNRLNANTGRMLQGASLPEHLRNLTSFDCGFGFQTP